MEGDGVEDDGASQLDREANSMAIVLVEDPLVQSQAGLAASDGEAPLPLVPGDRPQDSSSSSRFDATRVDSLMQDAKWGELELYLRKYIEGAHDITLEHAALFLCCREAQLATITAEKGCEAPEAIDHLNTAINTLRDSASSLFVNDKSLRQRIQDINDSMTDKIPLKINIDKAKNEIMDYMRLYFPDVCGYYPVGKGSQYYEFTMRDGKKKWRCMVCGKPFTYKPSQWLQKHFEADLPCPNMTQDIRRRYENMKGTSGLGKRVAGPASSAAEHAKKGKTEKAMQPESVGTILECENYGVDIDEYLKQAKHDVNTLGCLYYREHTAQNNQEFAEVQSKLIKLLGNIEIITRDFSTDANGVPDFPSSTRFDQPSYPMLSRQFSFNHSAGTAGVMWPGYSLSGLHGNTDLNSSDFVYHDDGTASYIDRSTGPRQHIQCPDTNTSVMYGNQYSVTEDVETLVPAMTTQVFHHGGVEDSTMSVTDYPIMGFRDAAMIPPGMGMPQHHQPEMPYAQMRDAGAGGNSGTSATHAFNAHGDKEQRADEVDFSDFFD